MSLKVARISDIHAEFYTDHKKSCKIRKRISAFIRQCNPDVVVFAGDTAKGDMVVSFINDVVKDLSVAVPHIIFVTGNHEYYYAEKSIDQVNSDIQKDVDAWNAKNDNRELVFLNDSSFVVEKDGVSYRFSGGTLWTDQNLHGDSVTASLYAGRLMNDYNHITGEDGERLTPFELVERHKRTLAYLKSVLEGEKTCDVDIVVTHHQPTPKTLSDNFKNHCCAPSYASNLEDLIKSSDVKLWVAGHHHGAKSVFVGNTLVANNTHGYPGQFEHHEMKVAEITYEGNGETSLALY